MPNQRDIAQKLGISQAAVSLALRGHPSISPQQRKRVEQTAKALGYQANPYVSSLMAQIKAGRQPADQGVLALIVDIYTKDDWFQHPSYQCYHAGIVSRSKELGFKTDYFFLKEPGVTAASIDRILYARGIRGVIMAPPYLSNRRLGLSWPRYACVGTGYGWEQQQIDRVAHDHDQNAAIACRNLCALGYRRTGLCITTFYAKGRGTRWTNGFLACQHKLHPDGGIPVFIHSGDKRAFKDFKKWLNQWQPDSLLTVYGQERKWLDDCGLKAPDDIGLACLIKTPDSDLAGINDRYDQVGKAAVELVASKISYNQFGIPPYPKITLIEGQWENGTSLDRVGPALTVDF